MFLSGLRIVPRLTVRKIFHVFLQFSKTIFLFLILNFISFFRIWNWLLIGRQNCSWLVRNEIESAIAKFRFEMTGGVMTRLLLCASVDRRWPRTETVTESSNLNIFIAPRKRTVKWFWKGSDKLGQWITLSWASPDVQAEF